MTSVQDRVVLHETQILTLSFTNKQKVVLFRFEYKLDLLIDLQPLPQTIYKLYVSKFYYTLCLPAYALNYTLDFVVYCSLGCLHWKLETLEISWEITLEISLEISLKISLEIGNFIGNW